jgi:hypothetical protein
MNAPSALEVAVPNRRKSRLVAALAVVASVAGLGLVGAGHAEAASRWAPAATAAIHPGAETITVDGQCTANFVFFRGTEVFLGQAAHCASLGTSTDTDGCHTASRPIGTPVKVEGASRPGVLVYSSWITMQQTNEQDPYACAYNDLALVKIDPADVGKVNPSIPHWGGPTGINRTGIPPLAAVYTYGNSSLRQGIALLSPKSGISLGTDASGWSHSSYTLTPGIPGDSGSALLDAHGRAAGVLSTIMITPLPASNSWGDISRELRYARDHGMGNVLLALGTVPFNPHQLPLGL